MILIPTVITFFEYDNYTDINLENNNDTDKNSSSENLAHTGTIELTKPKLILNPVLKAITIQVSLLI
jgi:hypothetical protein